MDEREKITECQKRSLLWMTRSYGISSSLYPFRVQWVCVLELASFGSVWSLLGNRSKCPPNNPVPTSLLLNPLLIFPLSSLCSYWYYYTSSRSRQWHFIRSWIPLSYTTRTCPRHPYKSQPPKVSTWGVRMGAIAWQVVNWTSHTFGTNENIVALFIKIFIFED